MRVTLFLGNKQENDNLSLPSGNITVDIEDKNIRLHDTSAGGIVLFGDVKVWIGSAVEYTLLPQLEPDVLYVVRNSDGIAMIDLYGDPPSLPNGLFETNVTINSLVLNWNASVGSNPIVEYEVRRDGILVGTTTDTFMLITGLTAQTTYLFDVRAKDVNNVWSGWSNPIQLSTV